LRGDAAVDVELPGVYCDICGEQVTVPRKPWWRKDDDVRDIRRLEITMAGDYVAETCEVFVCKRCMDKLVKNGLDGSSFMGSLLALQGEHILAMADEGSDECQA